MKERRATMYRYTISAVGMLSARFVHIWAHCDADALHNAKRIIPASLAYVIMHKAHT